MRKSDAAAAAWTGKKIVCTSRTFMDRTVLIDVLFCMGDKGTERLRDSSLLFLTSPLN